MVKSLTFLPDAVKQNRKIQRTLFRGLAGKDLSTPLTFQKHLTVWWDKKPFKRRGEWLTVYREPNGRFARKPSHGDRAKFLGLPRYT
jgi:hypothetical protein